ncbi:hypothetical protein G6F56_014546 [Rhizopus delemar]|nr:hypothetical protein G6F56_014546 [Rhizopus delemar]
MIHRLSRHLLSPAVRRAFPPATLQAITEAIAAGRPAAGRAVAQGHPAPGRRTCLRPPAYLGYRPQQRRADLPAAGRPRDRDRR